MATLDEDRYHTITKDTYDASTSARASFSIVKHLRIT